MSTPLKDLKGNGAHSDNYSSLDCVNFNLVNIKQNITKLI